MLNSTPWTSTEKQNYQLFLKNNYICFSFNFFLIFYIISTILKKWKVQMLKCSNLWRRYGQGETSEWRGEAQILAFWAHRYHLELNWTGGIALLSLPNKVLTCTIPKTRKYNRQIWIGQTLCQSNIHTADQHWTVKRMPINTVLKLHQFQRSLWQCSPTAHLENEAWWEVTSFALQCHPAAMWRSNFPHNPHRIARCRLEWDKATCCQLHFFWWWQTGSWRKSKTSQDWNVNVSVPLYSAV